MFDDLFIIFLILILDYAVATPKQIRELMKVDGLTNDEVKSHLQVGFSVLEDFYLSRLYLRNDSISLERFVFQEWMNMPSFYSFFLLFSTTMTKMVTFFFQV